MDKSFEIITFKGSTNNGEAVRITLDEDFIYGIIETKQGTYVIDQLRYFLKDSSLSYDQIIVYRDDKVKEKGYFCAVTPDMEIVKESIESPLAAKTTTSGCFALEVAADADFEFWSTYGGNTQSRIFGYFNTMDIVYETTFDLDVDVVNVHVWTTAADPYTSTIPATINNEVGNVWGTTFANVERDVVRLFTGKNLGLNLGRANALGTLCDDISNNFTTDHPTAYKTLAHEIGHNLNAQHPTSGCSGGNQPIMCQGTAQKVPLYFSTANRTRINNHMNANEACIITGTPDIDLFIDVAEWEGSAFYVSAHVSNAMGPYSWYLNGVLQSATGSSFSKRYACEGGTSQISVRANTDCGFDWAYGYYYEECGSGGGHRMEVYPNPADSEKNISPSKTNMEAETITMSLEPLRETQDITLTLLDFSGKPVKEMVFEGQTNDMKMNVSTLSKGIYFLKIVGRKVEETHTIIIE